MSAVHLFSTVSYGSHNVGSLGSPTPSLLPSFLQAICISIQASHHLLHHFQCPFWATGLGRKHLTTLVHYKHTSSRALRWLLQSNGANQGGRWVAEESVGQLLLVLEVGVGLGAVGAEPIDTPARVGELVIGVTKEAYLLGTYISRRVNRTLSPSGGMHATHIRVCWPSDT